MGNLCVFRVHITPLCKPFSVGTRQGGGPRVSSLMEIGARPHIYLEINGARVKALVDSGANVSLLHDRFLKMMHNKKLFEDLLIFEIR